MRRPIRFVENCSAPDAQPGDAQWLSSGGEGVTETATGAPVPLREFAALAYRCPGCNDDRGVDVRTAADPPQQHAWAWDGNREAPTLTPSLRHMDCACRWHGHLTAGVFIPC